MLSSQWKWWCKQEKKLLVDYAVMKEYTGAFVAVLRDEVRWRSASESATVPLRLTSRRRGGHLLIAIDDSPHDMLLTDQMVNGVHSGERLRWQATCFRVHIWVHGVPVF